MQRPLDTLDTHPWEEFESSRKVRPVGLSPMGYLRQMRVERMARVLASTDLSATGGRCTTGANAWAWRIRLFGGCWCDER